MVYVFVPLYTRSRTLNKGQQFIVNLWRATHSSYEFHATLQAGPTKFIVFFFILYICFIFTPDNCHHLAEAN